MSTQSRTELPLHIGALLRTAWDELMTESAQRLAEAGYGGLRRVHYPIIRDLLLGGQRPTDVATALGLSKQAVNDLLREFELLGYIALEPDPRDGRAKLITVTERGKSLLYAASTASADVGRRWASTVGPDRYAVFEEVLREIVDRDPPAGD